MKKIKIGIPRAMQYYQYGLLWKNFFEGLNCNVILSPKTNRKIISVGRNNSIEETCLSYKIYIGHVLCSHGHGSRTVDFGSRNS